MKHTTTDGSAQEMERRLNDLRAELQPALERLDNGEGLPLDIEAIMAEGRAILARHGDGNQNDRKVE